jgi:anaphase-promoting complex subunit 7
MLPAEMYQILAESLMGQRQFRRAADYLKIGLGMKPPAALATAAATITSWSVMTTCKTARELRIAMVEQISQCFAELHDFESSAQFLERVPMVERSLGALLRGGRVYQRLGKTEAATLVYKAALTRSPHMLEALYGLIDLKVPLNELLPLIPDQPELAWVKQVAHVRALVANNRHRDALTVLGTLEKSGGANTYVLAQRAYSQYQVGDIDAALASFEAVARLDARCVDYADVHAVALRRRELSGGLSRPGSASSTRLNLLCDQLVANAPSHAHTWTAMAVYSDMKAVDNEKTVRYLERAIQLNDQNVTALMLKALLQKADGHFERALQTYRRVAALNRGEMEVYEGMVHCYLALDRLGEAIVQAKELFKLSPKDPKVLTLSASVLTRVPERHNVAQSLLERVISQHPDYLDAVSAQVDLFLAMGKSDEAIAFLNGYIERQPDNDVLQTQLGHVYEELGQLDEAEKQYKRALSINPQNRLATASLQALDERRKEDEEEEEEGGGNVFGDDDDAESW